MFIILTQYCNPGSNLDYSLDLIIILSTLFGILLGIAALHTFMRAYSKPFKEMKDTYGAESPRETLGLKETKSSAK